ncbi:MAG: DUF4089 domain-containing protein [Xenococcus sp. MO_188.B8]|nr:DUF4089 domain-containing protein [Xenococcus sp. MO_188.B8]
MNRKQKTGNRQEATAAMINREENARDYVLETAKLLDLTINPKYLPKVVENWLAITKIASLVTEFELSEEQNEEEEFF